ncbi:MAG: hypothetical protein OQK97_08810 [Deltaproteobacteria bacterium]|jgi:hypothetical protein|nr:hypothetical protein [Deltaproteobacteria bacterium]
MSFQNFTSFSRQNRRQIGILLSGHLLWGCALMVFWAVGQPIDPVAPWWSAGFVALQLYAAAQLLLPALLIHPEERTRFFYFFWGGIMILSLWLINQLPAVGMWQLPLSGIKSGLLLLVGTLIGTALARFVNRFWEVIPVCLAMTLADFFSWLIGPTANFALEIEQYYLAPVGPPPLIDILLVKLAFPGSAALAPVFGISDWIMVAFFVSVSRRYAVNDNLIGRSGETLTLGKAFGRYLPLPVVALFTAVILAQSTGLFIPVLPLIAVVMLLWYTTHYLLQRRP